MSLVLVTELRELTLLLWNHLIPSLPLRVLTHNQRQMIIRRFILAVVLLTSAFAQNAAVSSSAFHGAHQLRTDSALAHAFAQKAALETSGLDRNYKLSLPKPVQDKNFYLLSLFQRNPQARRLLSQNKVLKSLAADKVLALKKAASCDNVACFDQLIRFDDPTIEAVA